MEIGDEARMMSTEDCFLGIFLQRRRKAVTCELGKERE